MWKLFPFSGDTASSIPTNNSKIKFPEIRIIECENKKLEKCERHVKQLLIRGEQIAFVTLSNT